MILVVCGSERSMEKGVGGGDEGEMGRRRKERRRIIAARRRKRRRREEGRRKGKGKGEKIELAEVEKIALAECMDSSGDVCAREVERTLVRVEG